MPMGKEIRLSRLMYNNRMLCVPLDHGVTDGLVKGLEEISDTIKNVEQGGATAIVVHKGIIRSLNRAPKTGIIMHVSASTTLSLAPNRKVQVGTVNEALRLGADAISVHVNIGCREEPEMLMALGSLSDQCSKMGMPLLAMMYPRGENIKNPYDPKVVGHVARIGAELGADIVKTVYTGDVDSFREIVKGCPVPVVIAGGPKIRDVSAVLRTAAGAIQAGAIGVSFGRNVFQHDNPRAILKALSQIVLKNRCMEEALLSLQTPS